MTFILNTVSCSSFRLLKSKRCNRSSIATRFLWHHRWARLMNSNSDMAMSSRLNNKSIISRSYPSQSPWLAWRCRIDSLDVSWSSSRTNGGADLGAGGSSSTTSGLTRSPVIVASTSGVGVKASGKATTRYLRGPMCLLTRWQRLRSSQMVYLLSRWFYPVKAQGYNVITLWKEILSCVSLWIQTRFRKLRKA